MSNLGQLLRSGAFKLLAQSCLLSFTLFGSITSIAGQCTAPIFSAPPEYAVGLRPTSVAIGDFNGDNKPDLVTANSQSSNISIVLGDGVGGFGPPKHFPVVSEPGSVAVDDFNKDGKADVVVEHFFGGGRVSILFGNGLVEFPNPPLTFNIPGPNRVITGDFNGDTNPDVAVGSFNSPPRILLGNGAGNFTGREVIISALFGDTRNIAAGEFNGDGITDLAIALNRPPGHQIFIVFGRSGGTFVGEAPISLDQSPRAIIARDFSGDGRADLAVAVQDVEPRLMTFLNNGVGGFGPPSHRVVTPDPSAMVSADFNADNKIDLALASREGSNVQIFLGIGGGDFTAGFVRFSTGKSPQWLVAADFSNDGNVDLVSANAVSTATFNPAAGSISVLLRWHWRLCNFAASQLRSIGALQSGGR